MNDEQVDALLQDLDTALSVQPSVAAAARVRTRIDARAGARRPLSWGLAVASVAAILSVGYLTRRVDVTPSIVATVAPAPAAVPNTEALAVNAPDRATSPRVDVPVLNRTRLMPSVPVPAPAAETSAQPEVLVPADGQMAFARMEAAMRAGLVSVNDLAGEPPVFTPVAIIPTSVVPTSLQIDPSRETPGAGGIVAPADSRPGEFWFDGPLRRSRS